jgi:hypothetical protein
LFIKVLVPNFILNSKLSYFPLSFKEILGKFINNFFRTKIDISKNISLYLSIYLKEKIIFFIRIPKLYESHLQLFSFQFLYDFYLILIFSLSIFGSLSNFSKYFFIQFLSFLLFFLLLLFFF